MAVALAKAGEDAIEGIHYDLLEMRDFGYRPCLRLSMIRRMTDPPYAPAIPGRKARNDP
jgi:hypothetical protein